jgi:hypothetical protein
MYDSKLHDFSTFNENADLKAPPNDGFSLPHTVTTKQRLAERGYSKRAIRVLIALLAPILQFKHRQKKPL